MIHTFHTNPIFRSRSRLEKRTKRRPRPAQLFPPREIYLRLKRGPSRIIFHQRPLWKIYDPAAERKNYYRSFAVCTCGKRFTYQPCTGSSSRMDRPAMIYCLSKEISSRPSPAGRDTICWLVVNFELFTARYVLRVTCKYSPAPGDLFFSRLKAIVSRSGVCG